MYNSKDNQLGHLRPYVLAIMHEEGRDFETCEECDKAIPNGRYEIHHTKYSGATYYDLRIVCMSCNRIAKNVGLA